MSAALRRAALARAEDMRSPRAAEVLRRAELEARERDAWESSDGTVRAVDVHLRLDGFALGLTSWPSVHDAVVEAISAVAPEVLGASVIDLSFEWALKERSGLEGYRDVVAARVDPRSSSDLQRALAAYLDAAGDPRTARAVDAGTLRLRGERTVELSFDPRPASGALEVLLGGPVKIRRVHRNRS